MGIIVQKFGGTSVANLECMQQVLAKVTSAHCDGANKVVVVLSAMSGETNRLIDLASQWSTRPDSAEMDSLVSTGEQVSVALFSMLLKDAGYNARSILGHQAEIKTDSKFGRARILDINSDRLKSYLEEYDILVVAGFQGINCDGRITTLGRGGSDTSAVALAVAVDADVCEIFTDVEGVYTTDPNLCSTARKIPKISYDEMLEMASMGAKVLQIRSVEFAKKYNMTVHVRSTFSDCNGTFVTQEDESMEAVLVSGIAYDKDQIRVTVCDVEDRPGVASAIFLPLADAGIVVDMIIQNTSRDGKTTDMTFTVPRNDLEKTQEIINRIESDIKASEVLIDERVSKVSVIGVGMRSHSGVASRMFESLCKEGINILMISTSEIKVTCLIEEKYTELAVGTLHDTFELDKEGHVCT
ncbi:aspartate kinase [Desulfovibrio ferrophilus]|uniref:Aspartokinase n=1 Tax=Desulfovibrio ferrophilus TaxID=241368 RepID=A0A2Z6AWH5_9BACT|nr:aspartate kinase [Desulfovibrio ferrophilus]BBD07607.1 aspartate kinase [Desulfovibrio ferrophilus]